MDINKDISTNKKPSRCLTNEPFIQKILLNCLSLKIRELKSKGKILDK